MLFVIMMLCVSCSVAPCAAVVEGRMSRSEYTVDEGAGSVQVCVSLTAIAERELSVSLTSQPSTASGKHKFT